MRPVSAMKPSRRPLPVLHLLQPGAGEVGKGVDGAGREVAQVVLQVRPDAFRRIEVRGIGGKP
jgi:hypothetical protein